MKDYKEEFRKVLLETYEDTDDMYMALDEAGIETLDGMYGDWNSAVDIIAYVVKQCNEGKKITEVCIEGDEFDINLFLTDPEKQLEDLKKVVEKRK